MTDRTYIRTLNTILFDKMVVFSVIKNIVTFYYDLFLYHPNIFKKKSKVSITNSEHKNCLAFLKAAGDNNINFIY